MLPADAQDAVDEGSVFARLPEDVTNCLLSFLSSYSLRAVAATNRAWRRALQLAPEHLQKRANWKHRWTAAGAGATIETDPAVCTGGGTWHPGGVALASTMLLSTQIDCQFRLIIDRVGPGDLLMGITQYHPEISMNGSGEQTCRLLEMGYHYIMGRTSTAGGVDDEVSSYLFTMFVRASDLKARVENGLLLAFSRMGARLYDRYSTADVHGGVATQTQATPRVDPQLTTELMVAHLAVWRSCGLLAIG